MNKSFAKALSIVASVSMLASMASPVLAADQFKYHFVDVSATVASAFTFEIVDVGVNINNATNTCPLGTLVHGVIAQCTYGLRISTNSVTGYRADIKAVDQLKSGAIVFSDTASGTNIAVNVEGYGYRVDPKTTGGYVSPGVYTNPSIAANPYSASDHPVPTATSTNNVLHYNTGAFDAMNGGATYVTTSIPTVTHKAAISWTTPVGTYTQRVWWQAASNF